MEHSSKANKSVFLANHFEAPFVIGSMRTGGRPGKLARAAMLAALVGALLFGQSSDAPLKFEVASIKPSSADEHRVALMLQPGGGFRASGATLKMLLTMAYNVREFQISGGPNWISSDRYD